MELDKRHDKVDIGFEIIQYLRIMNADGGFIIVFLSSNLSRTTWCIMNIASRNYDSCAGVIGLEVHQHVRKFISCIFILKSTTLISLMVISSNVLNVQK